MKKLLLLFQSSDGINPFLQGFIRLLISFLQVLQFIYISDCDTSLCAFWTFVIL